MKYAVEVAKSGSLNKASEILLIAQPNLSRSIKELEADLGITIFERTTRGMTLTPEGEEFIGFAKGILSQIEQDDKYYKENSVKKQKFSVSVPRACYISEAFAEFSKTLTKDPAEIFYKETNSQITVQNVIDNNCNLGIIRYAENYDKYFNNGDVERNSLKEFDSNNTALLTVEEVKAKLLTLQYIRDELDAMGIKY